MRSKLIGNLDRLDHTVAGWALDKRDPERAIGITLVQDGKVIHRWSAVLYRADVAAAHGSGHHAFSLDLDKVPGVLEGALLEVFAEEMRLGAGTFSPRPRAARGDDGWLFLQNDSNDVNARITGAKKVEVSGCVALFVERDRQFHALGLPWLPVIIPEKNVVCQHLWRAHTISASRPVCLIEERLRAQGIDPGYLIEEAMDVGEEFFLRTDTHPSATGYLAVMRALARRCPAFFDAVPLPAPKLVRGISGDLGVRFDPPVREDALRYTFPRSQGQGVVLDTVSEALRAKSMLRGNVAVIRNDAAPHSRTMVFGTSTAFRLMHYLAHAFREVVFIWENAVDYTLIRELAPELVIWIAAERFLPIECDDSTGVRQAAERLRSAGFTA